MEVSNASGFGTNYQVITISDKVVQDNSTGCFVCNKCLAGNEVLKLEFHQNCRECFEKLFGQRCLRCQELICGETEMSFIYYNNKVWHKNCFRCYACGTFLSDLRFVLDNNSVYCLQCRTR